MNEYHYIQTESQLWTVGTGDPGRFIGVTDGMYRYSNAGNFNPESDHDTPKEAAARVAFLNGGSAHQAYHQELDMVKEGYAARIAELESALMDAIGVLATTYPIPASKALEMAGRLNDLLDKGQS